MNNAIKQEDKKPGISRRESFCTAGIRCKLQSDMLISNCFISQTAGIHSFPILIVTTFDNLNAILE